LLEITAVAAWFVIVFSGKLPRGLYDVMVLANSYIARSDSYLYLLTETYPPFQDEQTRTAGTPGPPLAEPPSNEPPATAPPAAGPPIPEPPAAGPPPTEPPTEPPTGA
jgi:hypothetical protein